MDPLSTLLEFVAVRAGVFHTGVLCGTYAFDPALKPGHLHLIRSGSVTVLDAALRRQRVDGPAVLLFPGAALHTLVADHDADVVCATVQFGAGARPLLVDALPPMIAVAADALPAVPALLA